MPIRWKSKTLLAKIESAYGTDPTPSGAANAILATNIVLSPMEGQDVSRELELAHLAAQATVPTSLHMRLQFRVELAPSGDAGTAPAWGVLLRGCGCAQTIVADTSVAYNPISDNHESLTFYFWIGLTLYVMKGSRGTATMQVNAQGIPGIQYNFTGLFAVPTEESRASPTLTAFQPPLIATKTNTPTFTVNSVSLVMREFSLNLGNQVETRFLIGAENVLIVDRGESIAARVEAVPVSTLNPYALANAQTPVEVSLVHGTAAGSIATIDIAGAQIQRPAGLENNQNIVEWALNLIPLPVSGNDQWTLTLT